MKCSYEQLILNECQNCDTESVNMDISKRARILVACERSGIVRQAFRLLGHDAWSCDLEPPLDDSMFHIQGDVLGHLHDGWDMMIAHPPCTYLCLGGVGWLHKDSARWKKMEQAVDFFMALWNAPIPRIAIENPVPHKYAKLPKYSQIIQPWQFGHPHTKATCLWLKGLPKLRPTCEIKRIMRMLPKSIQHALDYLPPSPNRSFLRSITFPGISVAMAYQWGLQEVKSCTTS